MRKLLSFILCTLWLGPSVWAQISTDELPYSFSLLKNKNQKDIPMVLVSPPNVPKAVSEGYKKGIEANGVIVPVDVNLTGKGHWEQTLTGDFICRMRVKSAGAQALALYSNSITLSPNAKLFIYSPNVKYWAGAFTKESFSDNSEVALQYIPGDELVIELYTPKAEKSQNLIVFSEVAYLFKQIPEVKHEDEALDFGGAGTCNVNVNCSEGADWGNQRASVVRILLRRINLLSWCSGALINTTSQTCRPYILSADHCAGDARPQDFNQWIFYFNYESPTCANPSNDNAIRGQTVTGCKVQARGMTQGDDDSDMLLLLLSRDVPANYLAFFAGWNRTNTGSPSGVSIHHPDGDIKKISTYSSTLQSDGFKNPTTHWRVYWVSTANGHGVTEGGSSGSPLFDNTGLIVGKLTGGRSTCASRLLEDVYGKMWYSWDRIGTDSIRRLDVWLDDARTNVTKLQGIRASECGIVSVPKVADVSTTPISIFPNPGNHLLRLENLPENTHYIQVFDIQGKVVLLENSRSSDMEIQTTAWPKGIYLIQVNGVGGVESFKWIKQ